MDHFSCAPLFHPLLIELLFLKKVSKARIHAIIERINYIGTCKGFITNPGMKTPHPPPIFSTINVSSIQAAFSGKKSLRDVSQSAVFAL